MAVYLKCPKCNEKTLISSVFGSICQNCFYEPDQSDSQTANLNALQQKLESELETTNTKPKSTKGKG